MNKEGFITTIKDKQLYIKLMARKRKEEKSAKEYRLSK